jgi:monovalent cation/hydrogen antiporter
MEGDVKAVEIVFLLLLVFVTAFAFLARKLNTPYPIVLVIAGLALGFVPGMPRVTLNPDIVFLVVLPPLLYAAAWQTSWREFRYNIVSIALLAFGLVSFLVASVALLAPRFLAGFDWRMGFALGAVVATTDAIAATAIARKLGLPPQIVDVLEGESLLNDATGLLALEFAATLIIHGQRPHLGEGLARLVWLTAGGLTVGLVLGFVVDWLEQHIDDAQIEITLSLLIPYAAYLAAEAVHASGVLSVVACGLFLSRRSAHFFSPNVRLQVWSVWESITFALNGLVFVLIGLQLPIVLDGLHAYSIRTLIISGLLFSLLLIVLRLVWTFPGTYLANYIRRHLLGQHEPIPSARQIFVVGFTGMRGVVALAAALALPAQLADGSPFPQHDLILFLTFVVILVTLVVQGLALPPLIRALGLAGASGPNCEEQDAQEILIEAAMAHLATVRHEEGGAFDDIYNDLDHHYRQQLAAVRGQEFGDDGSSASHHERHTALAQQLLRVQRHTLIGLRDEGRINDEVLRRLERQLDLGEERLQAGL